MAATWNFKHLVDIIWGGRLKGDKSDVTSMRCCPVDPFKHQFKNPCSSFAYVSHSATKGFLGQKAQSSLTFVLYGVCLWVVTCETTQEKWEQGNALSTLNTKQSGGRRTRAREAGRLPSNCFKPPQFRHGLPPEPRQQDVNTGQAAMSGQCWNLLSFATVIVQSHQLVCTEYWSNTSASPHMLLYTVASVHQATVAWWTDATDFFATNLNQPARQSSSTIVFLNLLKKLQKTLLLIFLCHWDPLFH